MAAATAALAAIAAAPTAVYLMEAKVQLQRHAKANTYVVKGSPEHKAAHRAGMLITASSLGLAFALGGLAFAFLI